MDTEEACQEENACAQSELSMTTRKKDNFGNILR